MGKGHGTRADNNQRHIDPFNLFKLFMIYALLKWNAGQSAEEGIMFSVSLAFALPFLIILPVAGTFADRFSKRSIIVAMKVMRGRCRG